MAKEKKNEEMTKTETEYKDTVYEAFLAELNRESPDLSVIKAGIAKYGTRPLTDAQKEKFLFEALCAEIGKANPDMAVVKAGVENYASGKMSTEQKEEFLKTVFPEEKNMKSLGFRNTKAINNALKAYAELSEEGKLTSDQVKDFLLTTSPHGMGRNILTTLAMNAYAGDFKAKIMEDGVSKDVLENNSEITTEGLKCLLKLDKKMLREAIKVPDESLKKFSLEKLAESGKSESLSSFMSALSTEDAITVENENTTVVGGDNTLNVDGVKKNGLTVNQHKDNDDETKQVGDVDPQSAKDGKRRDFDFDKVKEQDIIQYMFEHWFLEGLSYALKAPFWLANKCLDTLDSKFDTSVPKSSLKPGEVEGNYNAIDFLNEQGSKIASACMGRIEDQKDYYDALYKTIKNNAGKDPAKWKVEKFNGKPVLDSTKEFDRMKMQGFNDVLLSSPSAADFNKKLNAIKEITKEDFETINIYTQIGARLAVSQYMARNPDGPFNDSCREKIVKAALANTNSILQTLKSINERMEYNYRMEHGIDERTTLNSAQKAELEKATEPVVEKFMTDLTNRGADLRSSVNQYNKRNNQTEKENYAKIMQINLHSLNNILDVGSGGYLDDVCPSRLEKRPPEKISIFDLAKQEEESVKLQGLLDNVSQRIENIEARRQELQQIKQFYKENYPIFRQFSNSLSNIKGKTGREVGEIKEDIVEFGKDVADKGKEVGKKVKKGVGHAKDTIFGREI